MVAGGPTYASIKDVGRAGSCCNDLLLYNKPLQNLVTLILLTSVHFGQDSAGMGLLCSTWWKLG